MCGDPHLVRIPKFSFSFSVWWHIPTSAFFTLGRSVSAWIDYSTTWNVLLVGPARYFFLFLPTLLRKLHGDGCCCTEPSEKFWVRPRYDYEKKHVSRDSKMCCCCCRFCCGAPTTDERTHAPVLHDASQIDYCRYWGRASSPPITSSWTLRMSLFQLQYAVVV